MIETHKKKYFCLNLKGTFQKNKSLAIKNMFIEKMLRRNMDLFIMIGFVHVIFNISEISG